MTNSNWPKIDVIFCRVSNILSFANLESISPINDIYIEAVQKYRFERDINIHIISRLLLIYGRQEYLSLSPSHALQKKKNGLPYFDRSSSFISISHNKDWIIISFSKSIVQGVDVEHIDEFGVTEFASEFLSDTEQKNILNLRNMPRVLARLWTAKEAYYKHSDAQYYFDPKNIDLCFRSDEISNFCSEQSKFTNSKQQNFHFFQPDKSNCVCLTYKTITKSKIEVIEKHVTVRNLFKWVIRNSALF